MERTADNRDMNEMEKLYIAKIEVLKEANRKLKDENRKLKEANKKLRQQEPPRVRFLSLFEEGVLG